MASAETPGGAPTACSAPGTVWLVVFFLIPLYFLGRLSLNVNVGGVYYPFDWHWKNYSDALSLYDTQFFRSFEYSLIATADLPRCSPIRWPTRSPSRRANGGTRCCSRWWRRSSPPT